MTVGLLSHHYRELPSRFDDQTRYLRGGNGMRPCFYTTCVEQPGDRGASPALRLGLLSACSSV